MKEKMIQVVKLVVVYAVLYALSAVLGEVVVILGFGLAGYDVLHGVFPTGYWVALIPLYGMALFIAVTVLYVKVIAKRKLSDIRMTINTKCLPQTLIGFFAGRACVAVVILVFVITGDYRFAGYGETKLAIALVTFGAFAIQSAAEEIMCRGFLQNFLEEKVSRKAAIFITALAFMAPHLTSMEADALCIVISIVNLLIVSVLFSLVMIRWNSIWGSIGIHFGWNYCLSYIAGLELSGMESGSNLFLFEVVSGRTWLHGGAYGMEAGIVVTILLLLLDIVIYLTGKDAIEG